MIDKSSVVKKSYSIYMIRVTNISVGDDTQCLETARVYGSKTVVTMYFSKPLYNNHSELASEETLLLAQILQELRPSKHFPHYSFACSCATIATWYKYDPLPRVTMKLLKIFFCFDINFLVLYSWEIVDHHLTPMYPWDCFTTFLATHPRCLKQRLIDPLGVVWTSCIQ